MRLPKSSLCIFPLYSPLRRSEYPLAIYPFLIINMPSILTRQLCSLALVASALSASTLIRRDANGAGYDTSRVGPDNANCQRQTYQMNITSNNIVFQDVDSNANTVCSTILRSFACLNSAHYRHISPRCSRRSYHLRQTSPSSMWLRTGSKFTIHTRSLVRFAHPRMEPRMPHMCNSLFTASVSILGMSWLSPK